MDNFTFLVYFGHAWNEQQFTVKSRGDIISASYCTRIRENGVLSEAFYAMLIVIELLQADV
jgi:hypothetical protein